MPVGAGKLIEQRGLAAVLVADKRKGQQGALGQRVAAALFMKATLFAQTGVGGRFALLLMLLLDLLDGGDLDLLRVCEAQGQLVAVYAQLHGVAQGRELDEGDLRSGDNAHV